MIYDYDRQEQLLIVNTSHWCFVNLTFLSNTTRDWARRKKQQNTFTQSTRKTSIQNRTDEKKKKFAQIDY